jgi:hypothetical protein
MNRIAIFVEGQTEQIFIQKLFENIAGQKNVRIEKRQLRGGRQKQRKMTLLEATADNSGEKYHVLIVDCGNDESVKSDIRDRYDEMASKGYKFIIGIRDVYPNHSREDIPKLRKGLHYKIKMNPITVVFVLGIMEVEAWFIAEHTHFSKLNSNLTIDQINTCLGYDPSIAEMQSRDHPANDLDKIYKLAGYDYNKRKTTVQRTVDILDYESLYIDRRLSQRAPDLHILISQIDQFLSVV